MVPRDIMEPQAHGILDLPEVPVRQAPQAILVQMATTATTVRRALQAILAQTATLARRAIKAIKVTKVLTVSRPQIKV